MEEYQVTLKIAAYLLGYPNDEWRENFSEYRAAIDEIKTPQIKNALTDLFNYVEKLGAKDYETLYVRSFDFSQNTNLYLTTHDRTDFGKQAQELHEYKSLFLENGFDLNNELPDYLPAILELAATVPAQNAKKILDAAKSKIELLRDRFIEAKLAHAFLLDAVLIQAENLNSEVKN
ncbi:MAG: nitrate reductase molybdenum cofactor assembly chaperone [Selenomonadaceae bacterium]|nr:nitrate reductase molybdenum cofactor assembly chaperone [Selenomonadaceae bacterium]